MGWGVLRVWTPLVIVDSHAYIIIIMHATLVGRALVHACVLVSDESSQ